MELSKKLTLLLFAAPFLFKSGSLWGQAIEIGGGINTLSNGIHLTYQQPVGERWAVNGGIRIMINTYSINENTQNFVYYQNGFASKIWEYVGLTGKLQYRLITIDRFSLNAQAAMLITWHGLKKKLFVYDFTVGKKVRDIIYTKPAPAVETTIGFNLAYDLTEKFAINAGVGFGIMYSNHSFHGKSLVSGLPNRSYEFGNDRDRGAVEYVGLDGLPMLYLGLKYAFNK